MLALALFMRLWQIDLTQFDLDQATLLRGAADALDRHIIPLTSGLSFTIGVRHPPLVTYVLMAPMLVSRNPVWLSAFQATLDAFAAVFVYAAVKDLAGRPTGVAAGLLYAVLPAAVIYSREVWNPSLVPTFCAVALWGTVGFLKLRDPRRLAAGLLAICCAAQLHPSAAMYLPLLLLIGVAGWRGLRWRPFIVAGGALALILAPYAVLQAQSGWADVPAMLRYLTAAKTISPSPLYLAGSLIGGSYERQVLTAGLNLNWTGLLADPLAWLTLGAAVAGIGVALTRPSAWILPLWLLLPILASIRSAGPVHPHYMLGLLPAAAALGGLALGAIPLMPATVVVLALLLGWRMVDDAHFQQAVAVGNAPPGYGMPLRYSMRAAGLLDRFNGNRHVFVGTAEAHTGTISYLAGERFPMTGFDSRNTLAFSPAGGLYLSQGMGHAIEALDASFGPPLASVPWTSGSPAYALFMVPANGASRFSTSINLQPLDANFDQAVELAGLDAPNLAAGQPSPVLLKWQILRTPAPGAPDVRFFGHLVDATAKEWSTNQDFQGFPREGWQSGDTVFTWFDLNPRKDAPRGGYWLAAGLYEAVGQRRLPLVNGDNEAGSAARLGPLKLRGAGATAIAAKPLATFGKGEISLLGVRVQGSEVVLTWAAQAKPRGQYTVFVHALDGAGTLVAQHDGLPAGGSYPTSLWDAGEVIQDVHPLQGSLAKATQLEIGLYTTPDVQRLPAADPSGKDLGGHILLPTATHDQVAPAG